MNEAIMVMHAYGDLDCKLGLHRIEELMKRIGDPHKGMKYIHVAGTNGKGSVCRYIYSVLRESGYKAGIFTSPHIEVINERIEYDGKRISDEELEACADEVYENVKAMAADGFERPTSFEIMAAAAFLYFSKVKAEYVVLEVGLGGRGDATNIIEDPLISVIASVSRDHMELLGDTLPLIAAEKAGIIKAGTPVVSNVDDPDAAGVIAQTAKGLNCGHYEISGTAYEITEQSLEGCRFNTRILEMDYEGVEIKMPGRYQIKNAITALTAIRVLQENGCITADKGDVYRGLLNTRNIGRFEVLKKDPYVIIDGAHNEKGTEELSNAVREYFPGKRVLMVTGMLGDKEVDKMLENFYGVADDFIATEPKSPRKLAAADMAEKIKGAGKNCIAALDPVSACEKAKELSSGYDAVIFAGSLYLLGEVRGYFI